MTLLFKGVIRFCGNTVTTRNSANKQKLYYCVPGLKDKGASETTSTWNLKLIKKNIKRVKASVSISLEKWRACGFSIKFISVSVRRNFIIFIHPHHSSLSLSYCSFARSALLHSSLCVRQRNVIYFLTECNAWTVSVFPCVLQLQFRSIQS